MKKHFYFLLFTGLVFASCGGSEEAKQTTNSVDTSAVKDTSTAPVDEVVDFKFHVYLANIPSPFETIYELSNVKVPFNNKLVNSLDNESKYITSSKKALNYGVYGIDLAYLATNDQFKILPKYFKTTRNIANSLNTAESFDKIVGKRMESNWENKDTITRLMDEAFEATDAYLSNNQRQLIAIQILTGGWIESQNILFSVMKNLEKDVKYEKIYKILNEQRFHLKSITELLKKYDSKSELKVLIAKMSALNDEFQKTNNETMIEKNKLAELSSKIEEIRTMIIN
jgi:hypothetical protein